MPFSVLIPVVRPERAKKCIQLAVENSGIFPSMVEVIAEEDTERIGCPKMLKRLVAKARWDYVVFLGDDTEPQENYLINAYQYLQKFENQIGLVGFNDGVWDGNKDMSTHWLSHKGLLSQLGGEFFHTGYIHCRCDRELADRARALNRYAWAPEAKLIHWHPLTMNRPDLMDEDYNRVYREWAVQHDIELFDHRKANGWKTKDFHQVFLLGLFTRLSLIKSDINEHMPILRDYARKAERVTEFGMRRGLSTIALLAGFPKKLTTYDIDPKCLQVYRHLKQIIHDTDFKFVNADTLTANEIEETDFLFIDTLHDYRQCATELARHANRVTQYIAFHDTETFGRTDESGGGQGLRPAIDALIRGGGWEIQEDYINNNGLTIIRRK
jgi:hypothetical protein